MNGLNTEVGPDAGAGHEPLQRPKSGGFARLAWLPIPLLTAAIIAGRAAGLAESYKSETLTLILSFTFYTLISLGTLFLIGRSFLALGAPALLLLECGVVLWSLAGTVGDAVSHGDANVNVTIFNTGILIAGLCHLAGAILSLRPQRPLRPTRLWLGAGLTLALGVLWLITRAALANWLPVFFIPGQGGTVVRYCVLISAITMFALSAGLLLTSRREKSAPFTSWYTLALLLLAVGLFGVMIQLSLGSVVNWLGRTAQWLGGVYLFFAAVAALRASDLPLLPHETQSRPTLYRDAMATVAVLAAAAVRLTFLSALGTHAPYVVFFPAVMFAALYGGWRAGLLATVLSAILAGYFWIEPVGRFAVGPPADSLGLAIFLLSGCMIAWMAEALRRARASASTAETRALLAAEREAAAEVLRKSEERYHTLFTGMTEGFALHEIICAENDEPVDYRFLEINPAFERLTGLKREHVVGRLVSEVLPDNEPYWVKTYGEVALTGRPTQFVSYSSALKKYYEVFAYCPAPRQFGVLFMDITERRRTEEALQKSHIDLELRVQERTQALRRQAELLELAYNAILVRDLDSKIVFWNRGAEELYGWTKAEAAGNVTHSFLKTEFPVPFDDYMAALTKEGRWEGDLVHTTKDGRKITVVSRHALQRDENGNPLAILEINLDITESRQLEAQLRQAQKMEALGTLSGGIAHDFNNILAVIIGFTELVADHTPKGSRDERHLARVMEASLRGRELVRQMLTFSRKTEQEKKPLQLSSIVKETAALLRATTPSTISVRVSIRSESGLIFGDPTQIQQILMNLCTNATYAMWEKGGVLDIELFDFSVSPSNGNPHGIRPGFYIKLVVRDTGSGISPGVIDRIFDPFFTTKKLGEGTGLGLSVVHGIVKQSEGYITVESEPGSGSTFTVYFPKAPGKPTSDTASDDAPPTGYERILFIDDEEALVEMGEEILAELGYEVTSCVNSKEALSLLKEDPSRFDLVITDQTMPDMTGVELAKEILALRTDMPIIMCTGFSHLVDSEKAQATGIKAFAMKPLTKREIAKTIRKVLVE